MKSNECFVKDLYAASFLLAAGMRLLRLQKEHKYYWFVFDEKALCEDLLNKYWRNEGQIAPKVYADSCRSLKDRVFAQR